MENSLQIVSEKALTAAEQPQGAPIAITALRVAYDYTYNREVLFALSENRAPKTVRSVYFDLSCLDDAGDPLGDLPGACLRGLSAAPGSAFGEDCPIVLPFRGTARVTLNLQKVVFTDDSVWRMGDAPMDPPVTEEVAETAVEAVVEESTVPASEATVEEPTEPSAEPAEIPAQWMNPPATAEGYRAAAEGLTALGDPAKSYLIKKFTALADKLEAEAAEAARKAAEAEQAAARDAEYKRLAALTPATADEYEASANGWKALGNYKDAPKRSADALKKAKSIRTSEKRLAQKRAEEERIAALEAAAKRKRRRKAAIRIGSAALAVIAVTLLIVLVAIPAARKAKYDSTVDLVSEGKYTEAIAVLEELGDYADSKERIKELKITLAGHEDALFYTSASHPGFVIENGTLSFNSTEYRVVGTKLVIPDYFDDQKVTAIAASAFSGLETMESVKLAPTVTTVGKGTFADCTALTSFEAPGLVTLDAEAFRGCTALEKIILPDSLTAIGANAFQGCTALTEVSIPENVRRLPDSLFLNCTALQKVTFSSRLTTIGNETFGYCTSLPSLALPDTLESIGNNAFLSCTSFTTLTIPDNVTFMGDKAMASCTALTEVKLSANLSKIAARTFSGCKALTTLTLPTGLTQVGYAAFEGCNALTNVTYGGSESDFSKIEILAENDLLTVAKITFGG